MKLDGITALVTGGASGLGLAAAQRLVAEGAHVVVLDLPSSPGEAVAQDLGGKTRFVAADVTDPDQVSAAVSAAEEIGSLRALVHCAGIGNAVRLVHKDGSAGSLEEYTKVINVNLIGSFNVLRLAAASMAKNDEDADGERGACVLTASIAAFEGQIGQIAYSASKGGVVGMTIVAARDLARARIRVCTIAPGIMDTPLLGSLRDDIKASLSATVPNPSRLGLTAEYADVAATILRNGYLNGETIRLDGALRMAPR
jgi:NAD(P)-dependent dehydrogenase (short-subunit alcohol dehydrogenase family)